MSNIYKKIKDKVDKKVLNEPFRVLDVNKMCDNLLEKSPSFLSKHRKGNPGNHKTYFERKTDKKGKEIKGLYNILKK